MGQFSVYFQPEKRTAHEKELCQHSCDVIQIGGACSIEVCFSLRVILSESDSIRRTQEEIDRAYLDSGGGGERGTPFILASRYARPKAFGLSAVFGHKYLDT